jgi:hypothetical protein
MALYWVVLGRPWIADREFEKRFFDMVESYTGKRPAGTMSASLLRSSDLVDPSTYRSVRRVLAHFIFGVDRRGSIIEEDTSLYFDSSWLSDLSEVFASMNSVPGLPPEMKEELAAFRDHAVRVGADGEAALIHYRFDYSPGARMGLIAKAEEPPMILMQKADFREIRQALDREPALEAAVP